MSDVSTASLAAHFGLTPRSISDLVRRGIIKKKARGVFDLENSCQHYCAHLREIAAGRGGEDHVQTLTSERARLAREQADGQALKNAAQRGAFLPADAVEREWSGILRTVKSGLLAVPSRVAGDLQPHQIDAVDRAIRDVLTELSEEKTQRNQQGRDTAV